MEGIDDVDFQLSGSYGQKVGESHKRVRVKGLGFRVQDLGLGPR